MRIIFPVLLGMKTLLPADYNRFKKHILGRIHGEAVFLKNGLSDEMSVRWIIDADGVVFMVETIRLRREWLRPLRWWDDLTLRECRLRPLGVRSVSEVLGLVAQCDSDPQQRYTSRLKRHLKKLDPDSIFDSAAVRLFFEQHVPGKIDGNWGRQLEV